MSQITLKRIGSESEATVQKIFENSPGYFLKVDGSQVLPHFAKKEMTDAAKKRSPTYEKIFVLALSDGIPMGVVDFHKDHPTEGITYIGLLLLDEAYQGKGLGRAVYSAAETYAKFELGAHTLRLGVSERNAVQGYWEKMGFVANGRHYMWQGEKVESRVVEMDKVLIDFKTS